MDLYIFTYVSVIIQLTAHKEVKKKDLHDKPLNFMRNPFYIHSFKYGI